MYKSRRAKFQPLAKPVWQSGCRSMSLGRERKRRPWIAATVLACFLVGVSPTEAASADVRKRTLLQAPSPFATLGPQPDLPGLSVEAVLDLWGVGLLPFGLDMQQTLLNALNETVQDAQEDELQLLAVEELLPLSGPSSVSVNGNRGRSEAPGSSGPSPPSAGRRMLSLKGTSRRLLQVLAAAGNSSNLSNLPHLEVRVRIASPQNQAQKIQEETIAAVNGPLLPKLNEEGINVSYIQLTALSLNYGNGTSRPIPDGGGPRPRRPNSLSSAAIGLIIAAAIVIGLSGLGLGFYIWRRRRQHQRRSVEGDKSLPTGSLTSVQADSVHTPSSGLPDHHSLILSPSGRAALLQSHSNSLVSSRSSQHSIPSADKAGGIELAASDLDTGLFGVPFTELQFSRVIGEGSFGRVFLGKWRETTVAIKILNAPGGPLPDDSWDLQDLTRLKEASWSERQQGPSLAQSLLVQELRKEANLMAGLRHPNIVMFLGLSIEPPCMVTEFCARGSLLDVLHRARTNKAVAAELDWRRRLRLMLDAAKGMLYLHSRQPPVLHRDLKSANLLVDKHWQVKVADFNLSRVMQPSAAVSSLAATNPRWLPPEVLSGIGYGAAADVYAYGIIMWELLTWRVPWEDDTPWQVVISVVDHDKRPEIPSESSLPGSLPVAHSQYLEVMKSCWATKPEDRPPFATIINLIRSMIELEDGCDAAAKSGMPCSSTAQSSAAEIAAVSSEKPEVSCEEQ